MLLNFLTYQRTINVYVIFKDIDKETHLKNNLLTYEM